jgi:hypothetical protein
MSNWFPNREPGPLMQYWKKELDTIFQISGAHVDEADKIFEAAGIVQRHKALEPFRFIRGETLLQHDPISILR